MDACSVFCRGIPASQDYTRIKGLFGKFGTVRRVLIKSDSSGTQCAIVTFASERSAKAALRDGVRVAGGVSLAVEPAAHGFLLPTCEVCHAAARNSFSACCKRTLACSACTASVSACPGCGGWGPYLPDTIL